MVDEHVICIWIVKVAHKGFRIGKNLVISDAFFAKTFQKVMIFNENGPCRFLTNTSKLTSSVAARQSVECQ
jgi:hypothetical protein